MRIVLSLLLQIFGTQILLAGERIALVIGNSKYEHIEPLRNPEFDAKLLSKALSDSAFTVMSVNDLTGSAFRQFVTTMTDTVKTYVHDNEGIVIDAVLLYYAGHAVQLNGENYLLPIDIVDNEIDVVDRGIKLSVILDKLGSIGAEAKIVILDSCRDNPFSEHSSGFYGLAEIEAEENTYIAFATKPGGVASDGEGDNSPFSSSLAYEMGKQNLTIEEMFKRVRKAVLDETKGEQLPWDASSLTGEFSFRPTGNFGDLEIRETVLMKDQNIWDRSVKDSNDAEAYRAYLMMFPNGLHSSEARRFLGEN